MNSLRPLHQDLFFKSPFDGANFWLGVTVSAINVVMTRSFDRLVERQIQKALAEGKLRDLEGEGKPLPDRSGEAFTDMATAVAIRMMAEAGVLPEEFKIRKLLEAAKQSYREAEGDDAKRIAMALIADLQQRYNIAVEARRRFMGA